jgi:glycosyltransferase involved in cell wall biosynthesis
VTQPEHNSRLKLLLVGAMPNIDRASSLGGVATLFHYLLADLSGRPDIETKVVDLEAIQRPGLKRWLACFGVLFEILRYTPQCDVLSIHAGNTSLHLSGPPLVFVAWVFRKPLIIRQGAGTHYGELSPWKGALVRWAASRAAFYLVETQRLVKFARADGLTNAFWFPNNRPLARPPAGDSRLRGQVQRFVFISRVSRTKGVLEILEAGRHLPKGVTIDVYGPFDEDFGPHIFEEHESVFYKGLLPPDRVMERLLEYDVLLLPTYYPREGYPGIIIEAFAAGLPVICTRWMSLDELVNDRCGILVNPQDSSNLLGAMQRIREEPGLFQSLRQGALERAGEFSSAVWTDRFLAYCREVLMHKSSK